MAKTKTRDFFAWTDDEVELLLKVTNEYKDVNAAENIDWESLQSKYADILERYREYYPSPEEAVTMGKEYPHKKDEITKAQLTTKLKAIRWRYRQAVDSGRKRGHGRVVLLYFDLCESIWGGSPTTHPDTSSMQSEDMVTEDAASVVSSGSPTAFMSRVFEPLCAAARPRPGTHQAAEVPGQPGAAGGGRENGRSRKRRTEQGGAKPMGGCHREHHHHLAAPAAAATNKPLDEDEHFFMSLIPAAKRLPPRKRADIKLKFMQILIEAEFGEDGDV